MSKAKLNNWSSYVDVEHLAALLQEQGVTCERKRNGDIAVKSYVKAMDDFFSTKKAVCDIFEEQGNGKPKRQSIDYSFFDHAGYCTADDGLTIVIACPYHAVLTWPALIPYMWEKGYYVVVDDKRSFGDDAVVLIRKRRQDDMMYQFVSSKNIPRSVLGMDFSSYVLKR